MTPMHIWLGCRINAKESSILAAATFCGLSPIGRHWPNDTMAVAPHVADTYTADSLCAECKRNQRLAGFDK